MRRLPEHGGTDPVEDLLVGEVDGSVLAVEMPALVLSELSHGPGTDFAAYAAAHVPKISAQTAGAFGAWIRKGRRRNLPVDAPDHFQAVMAQSPSAQEAK